MKTTLLNIFYLGLKELRSLLSDPVMVVFVLYAFTLAIQVQATGTSSDVRNASIAFVDDRPGHDFRYGVRADRLRELGWSPRVRFEEGIERTIAWYRDNPAWTATMRAAAG